MFYRMFVSQTETISQVVTKEPRRFAFSCLKRMGPGNEIASFELEELQF